MRWLERSGVVWVQAALGLAVAGPPSVAAADGIDCAGYAKCLSVDFSIELGPQRTGEFATLTLQDVAEGVRFTIALDEAVLGPHANLHEFYFNLPDGFRIDDDDVRLTSCDVSGCSIDLDQGRSVRGGAGADFDFSVAFDAGNRRIQTASFVVSALGLDADGVLAAALENPGVTGRDLAVLFAAHVQGSGNGRGSASATVGVPVPEPDTVALFGLGLAGLAFAGRRRS